MHFDFRASMRAMRAACLPLFFLSGFACAPAQPRSPMPPARAAAPAPEPTRADVAPPSPESSAKVDELVARHIAARGGIDKIRALQSIRLTGTERFIEDDYNIEASYGLVQKRPASIRIESSFQGLTGVDAYDGKEMWSTEPWEGRREAFKRSADEAKALAHDADIEGPLVDWRAKGHRVDYLGTEDIDGSPAHKLRVTLKDGDVQYRYLDPDTMLEFRIVYERKIRGVEKIYESDVGDYEQ